ncbi:uncharacterized protein LOC123652354 [Pipistrellus kuhlii]|uniref:Uncharacterized protein n=1 Tax=Pipistrellus kuhlii TaxID=59472 RepID=A0A7J7QUL9_PIPKU|nr:uncharacterized protein LOC123652354 [Pipistrellus kuhlii]KAF6267415.1 hypothetical protein mPipKuh1_008460 [Pipistrellus kuhlii]
MPEGQAPPGSSRRHRAALRRHHAQLLETETSPSALSFHWKEELLLRRQLGLLDAMKKREARARLTEQKAFYWRSHAQLQRVELAHARLRGDRDLVQRLSWPTRWSYPSGPSDESGAAVQAILQGRLGSEGAGTRHCSQEAPQHPAPIGGGQPGEQGPRAAPRGVTEAEDPWWVLPVEAQSRPEPSAQPSKPPGQTPPQAHEAGRQPEGKLLLYVMHGELDAEPPERKRPRPGERANARPHRPHRDSAPRDRLSCLTSQ